MSDRSWVDRSTILRCEVGSGVHGIASSGTGDRDEMGVCLEPYPLAAGIRETFEQHIYRTAAVRENKSDAPSQPGDLDLTIYSLRKWVRLALKGNPTVLVLLFAPDSSLVTCDANGRRLREMAPCFAARSAGAHYMGYLQAQRMRLLGERGQKNVNRRELVEQFGFDTKYAGHVVRLGYQGVEFLETGRITLPMPEMQRERIKAIRRGEVDLNDVLTESGDLEARLRDLHDTSPLPEKPDVEGVEAWMLNLYFEHWKATYGHEQALKYARAAAVPPSEAPRPQTPKLTQEQREAIIKGVSPLGSLLVPPSGSRHERLDFYTAGYYCLRCDMVQASVTSIQRTEAGRKAAHVRFRRRFFLSHLIFVG